MLARQKLALKLKVYRFRRSRVQELFVTPEQLRCAHATHRVFHGFCQLCLQEREAALTNPAGEVGADCGG